MNKKERKEYDRIRYLENREKLIGQSIDWKKRNPEKAKNSLNKYRKIHKKDINRRASIRGKKSNWKWQREYRKRLKLDVLIHYGGNPPKCACCGELIYKFLTIDHINNDGYKTRKTIGKNIWLWLKTHNFPEGYQVLCFNCNCGRAHNNGICPHKESVNN